MQSGLLTPQICFRPLGWRMGAVGWESGGRSPRPGNVQVLQGNQDGARGKCMSQGVVVKEPGCLE